MLDLTDNNQVEEMPVNPETLQSRFNEKEYPVYKDFVSFFVSGVVGIRHFDRNKTTSKYSSYVTISDEAFAVLSLENNWDRWSAMARDEEWRESEVATKWTTSREKKVKRNEYGERMDDEETPQATRYRGWSCHGISRYNQLFNEIREKRATKSFEQFEDYLLCEFKTEEDEEGKRKGKRQKIDNRKQLPDAHHELWDDEVPARTGIESNVSFPAELGMLGETAGV
jgi:hypothetical protein